MKRSIHTRLTAGLLACGLVLSLAACGGDPVPSASPAPVDETPVPVVSLPPETEPPQQEPAVRPENSALEAMADFGLRLLRSVSQGDNTLLSPPSVMTALGMTANGAEGDTLAEMAAVLGLGPEALNAALHAYWTSLPQSEGGQVRSANGLWFTDDPSFTVDPDFFPRLKDYDAQIKQVPFNEATCQEINDWVKDKTDGMVPDILDEIPEDAVMYLANALAFEAEWPEAYTESDVWDADFTCADGQTQTVPSLQSDVPDGDFTGADCQTRTVPFLHGEEFLYLDWDFATGFIKPYRDEGYAFAALLPREGVTVEELLDSLDGYSLLALLSDPSYETVYTAIPKFETAFDVELRSALSGMGMPLAFSENADFDRLGTSTVGPVSISRVLHKTYLSLGEQGTRAGAATVVEADAETAFEDMPEPKEVILDRPFVYLILDTETNVPLFLGTMMDPAQG